MNTQESYDRLAKAYVSHLYDELRYKPFDRKMLDLLIEKVNNPLALICDMGCGPGQVASYLQKHGAQACGIDLSPGMIEQAKTLNPRIPFETGNMLALSNVRDNLYNGIAAFYAIVHFNVDELAQALNEFRRVLKPGGVLLVTFHIGSEVRHIDELWGENVNLDFVFFEMADVKNKLVEAGFTLEEVIERDPYPESVEVQTRRAYIFAKKT